jgi:threonine synthase
VRYDFGAIDRARIESGPRSIWRYRDLLPVPADIATLPGLSPGWTRLVKADNLARELGLRSLWIKDDSGNPTHSFKDRVVAVALSAARELGFTVLACPSTGNLANAVAAAAAKAGIRSVVLVPSDLEQQKIVTTAVYGGTLVAVEGNYDDVNRLASEIAGEEEGWAFVNVNVRPYYAEGSKTLGYEVAEQLGWRLPEQVVIPVASGSQLTKVDKAFRELGSLGLVEATPYRIFGAQATGCSPVAGGVQGRSRRRRTGAPGDDREVAGDRQPGRRPVRPRRRPPDGRGRRGRQRRRGRRRDPAARPYGGHLRRDCRWRHGRDAAQAAARGPARSRRRDRRVQHR